jgi:hypothetical protein
MPDMFLNRVVLLLGMLTSAAGAVFAQAQASGGDLTGVVVDANRALIRGARITAVSRERGLARAAVSGESGEFRLPLLPPGIYTIRGEASGFASRVIEGVAIEVGQTLTIQVQLEVGAVTTEVTVQAEPPVVETERTQQATTLNQQRIVNLPINRRNYLDFALLAPGVVETSSLVDSNDYRVVQAPQSGLSFGGSNGRGNNFTVDGVENYMNSGGLRASVSQEAVQEFQINRNSFAAEFGNSFGGTINVITKGGSNSLHGNLFGFLRHRDLQARNYFDPAKSAFTRGQYGATVSGPLQRDRTFLFLGYERLERHETSFVPILRDRSAFGTLTPSQQQLADFFDRAPVPQLQAFGPLMRRYLITNNFPNTLRLFNENSGTFPFAESVNQVAARLDHHFGAHDSLFVRGNFANSDNENAQLGALVGFNRGRSIHNWDGTLMAANTAILNERWVSETRVMFGYDRLGVIPNDPFGPDVTISGFGSFGREIFLPSTTFERHYQLQQNVNVVAGRHSVKFGADVNPVRDVVRSETFFGGRFNFGSQIPLGLLLPQLTGDPNAAATLAATLNALGQPGLIANLSQPISALQSYNLGLPDLYQQGFGDPNWTAWFKRFGFFAQDSWKVSQRLTLNLGLRYDIEGEPPPLHTDWNNVAPRFGFAWTPFADAKTVIRGGAGLYYAQINAQIANLPATLDGKQIQQVAITALGIPGLNNPRTGQPLKSFDIYQTLAAQGVIGSRTIARQDLAQFGLEPGPNAFGRVLFGVTDDYVNPYAQQASLEIERAMGGVAVAASYQYTRGIRLPRILDRNLYYSGRLPSGQPTFGFYNPAVLQNNVEESTASSFYHALVLQASRRFSRHVAFTGHYTFSKTIDEVTDFNSDFQPQDQLNARDDRALSSFDQRHRFVFSGVFESPWSNRVLRDFMVSPIVQASSARPFNVLAGSDVYGDRHPTVHRPYGAGRNIGRGPAFFAADLRLTRRFRFGAEAQRNVEFTAEGFNLFNRTNFRSVNNVVGPVALSSLPSPIEGHRGSPTDPLAFTAAHDSRQFQLGLRINF